MQPQDSKNRDSLVSFVNSGFVLGFLIALVLSSYLQRGRFDQLFLFDAPDTPPVPGAFYPGPLGVHSFGDFLQPLWQARLSPSPFIAGYSSYLPAANGLFWLLNLFPFWVAFGFFYVASICCISYPIYESDSELDVWGRLRTLLGGAVFTYPFLSALDRGNIQLLTIGFVALSIHFSKKEDLTKSGAYLGIAIALKAYPALFLLLFLRKRQWRPVVSAVITAGILSLVPMILFDGGIVKNTQALIANLKSSQSELSSLALFSNNSLEAFSMSIKSIGFTNLSEHLAANTGLIVLILLVLLSLISCSRYIHQFEIAMLVACISTLAIGFSAGYVLLIFLIPALMIYQGEFDARRWFTTPYLLTIALIMMPKQIPLDIANGSYRQDLPSFASLLNPLLMLFAVGTITVRAIAATFRDWVGARGGT